MIIGYGISHDCGIAAVEPETGRPLFAASYERMNRVKNQTGDPTPLFNWLARTCGEDALGVRHLPLEDDRLFRPENGFYGLETAGESRFRWTAAEATIPLEEPVAAGRLTIGTLPAKVCARRMRATVLVDGRPVGRIDNARNSRFEFDLPPPPENTARFCLITIRADHPFRPDGAAGDYGVMIGGVSLRAPESVLDDPSRHALSESLAVRCIARTLYRQFVRLPFQGLRGHRARRFLGILKDYAQPLRYGGRSFADLVVGSLPRRAPRNDHHWRHGASAYWPSGFDRALVVSIDGMGDFLSARVFRGEAGRLICLKSYCYEEVPFALNYEIVTGMLGFNVLRHAGKITGLAALGADNPDCDAALDAFYDEMWRSGGRKTCNYDDYLRAGPAGLERLRALRETRFADFSREDVAFAIQKRTERQVVDFVGEWKRRCPDLRHIALAGGLFGNVKVNQRIHEMGWDGLFVQPAMSDAGLCFGAALLGAARANGGELAPLEMKTAFLGVEFSDDECRAVLEANGLQYAHLPEEEVAEAVAERIAGRKVLAHFDGRMEFGPRALGARSILYMADDPKVNDWLNRQLNRTEFMPFAPAVLAEDASEYFENIQGAEHPAEFMTVTFNCTEKARLEIPAAVHVDNTARPQLVRRDRNPRFHAILSAFKRRTGVSAMINTSFNLHEEPIVATPEDAVRAFRLGRLDVLVLGRCIVDAPGR